MICISLFFSSCNTIRNASYTEKISEISHVDIYYMKPCWCIEGDAQPEYSYYYNLIQEDDIRMDCECKINLPQGTRKTEHFLNLLFSSKEIQIADNNVRIKSFNGIEYYWQDGIVIDVFYKDPNREKDVYIMQNGKKVFYKKDEQYKYYKIPRQFLMRSVWK